MLLRGVAGGVTSFFHAFTVSYLLPTHAYAQAQVNQLKVAGNLVFSRSTNLDSKLIEFFVFVNV